jgi:hypothetical protein
MRSAFSWMAILWALLFAPAGHAQLLESDVCCILGQIGQEGVNVRAEARTPSECKAGQPVRGYVVCTSFSDPENICPSLRLKDLCSRCGYFWAGNVCLVTDPVVQAKKELEKDAKKPPAAPEKEPAQTPTQKPSEEDNWEKEQTWEDPGE